MIAAHSYAKSYGMQGTLVGVAALSPVWMSMSLWAAATTGAAGLTTATDVNSILYAIEYAYSAGELRVPGSGVSVFQTAKPSWVVPPLPGVTPPTTRVPYSLQRAA